MSTSNLQWVAVLAVATVSATVGRADVVSLSDGSRLVGTIERYTTDKLTIATEFAGTLEISAEKVLMISTAEQVNVGMSSGDRLVGTIELPPGTTRPVVHTAMGDIAVDMEQVAEIWTPDGKSPDTLAAEAEAAEAVAEAEKKVGKWSFTGEMGIGATQGNTDTMDARAALELKKHSEIDTLRFWVRGLYGEQNKIRNNAEVRGGADYEYRFGQARRWFAYTRSEAEYDEFEALDLRFQLAAGAGYYIIRDPVQELKTKAGVGYLHEAYFDGSTRDQAQGEVALEYWVELFEWLKFTQGLYWYPTFENLNDYRLVSDSGLLIPLANSDVWKLKLGALLEYKAIPLPGFEPLDQTYYANLVFDIKQK